MLNKLLLTLAAIGLVWGLFIRPKNKAREAEVYSEPSEGKSLSLRQMSYVIIGLLLLASFVLFVAKHKQSPDLMRVKVTQINGTEIEYQVPAAGFNGRSFTTENGRLIQLSESDRVESFPVKP